MPHASRPRRIPARLRGMLLVCAAWTVGACSGGSDTPAPKDVTIRGETARMADSLAAINRRAIPRAMDNPFMNVERAAALQALLATQGGAEAMETRFTLAEEQLKAGRTQAAIDGLEALVRDAGITWDSIAPHQKPFFDMLAIAYMRLGEQQNCLDNPAANICILPLGGAARHTKQAGARGAIERYTKILRQYPDDRGSQWLLNLAYLQVGEYPERVPPQYLIRTLVPAPKSGDFPTYRNVANTVGLGVSGLAGGTVVEDLNGDGLLDVFTTGWGLNDPVHVLLADGKGGYTDATAQAGLQGIVGGLNAVHADYDNDGDADIVILRGAWLRENGPFPLSLLRNKGDGTFEDITFDAGLYSLGPTNTAVFTDVNLDGWLDLFVGYESYSKINGGPSHRSKLFISNRNGTFTEAAVASGIDVDDFVKGATAGDVNEDGRPDLFLTVLYGKNRLFINHPGSTPGTVRFEETAATAGVQLPLAAFPTWFFDFDNDGHDDLFVPSYDVNAAMHEMVAREAIGVPLEVMIGGVTVGFEDSKLYRGRGDGTFEDVTAKAGLSRKVLFAMGSNFGDLDNDGFLDFYLGTGNPDLRSVIPNRMFRNVGGTRFEEVSLPGGFAHLQKGHAVAFADLDRDGDEDVFARIGGAYAGDVATSVLFENPGWAGTSWITLRLEGRAANRSAIGARVAITVADAAGAVRTIHRTVGTGGSFGSSPLELHVGLGTAAVVRAVRVQWPDAGHTSTSYTTLQPNRVWQLVQGAAPVALARPAVPFRTTGPATPHLHMPGM